MTHPATRKSTSVPIRRRLRLLALRSGFGAGRLAPALTARWGVRLFSTVPDDGGRRPDHRPRPGRLSRVRMPRGGSAVLETWGDPTGPPVYLLHGWGGWRGQLGEFIAPLVAAGRRVIGVDVPGHGDADSGWFGPGRGTLIEFAEALAVAAERFGRPTAVIAHSMGGAAAAVAVRDGLDVDRLVLVAAPADPLSQIAIFGRLVGAGQAVQRGMARRLERLVERPMRDFDLRYMPAVRTMPPALVIHDPDDKEVAYADGVGITSAWPGSTLLTTSGLGHRRILRDPAVVGAAVRFALDG